MLFHNFLQTRTSNGATYFHIKRAPWFKRYSFWQEFQSSGSKWLKPTKNELTWCYLTSFYKQTSGNSNSFHFPSFSALHIQNLLNCCRHKYNPSILQLFKNSNLWRVLAIWPNIEATRTVRTPKRRSTTTCRLWSFLDSRGIHSLRPDQSVRQRHYPGHYSTLPLPFRRCHRRTRRRHRRRRSTES